MNLIVQIEVPVCFKTLIKNEKIITKVSETEALMRVAKDKGFLEREVSMKIFFTEFHFQKPSQPLWCFQMPKLSLQFKIFQMKVLMLTLLLAVALAQRMAISDGGTYRMTPNANLIVNGRFTYPKTSPPEYKMYKKNEVIPWQSPNMEISGIRGGYNWGWTEGSVVCELASDFPSHITQTVFIPQSGSYQFYFEWAARQNYVKESTGSVSVGGVELVIITPTDERVYSQNITIWAQAGPLNVTFASTAQATVTCGLTVGNIYLYQIN